MITPKLRKALLAPQTPFLLALLIGVVAWGFPRLVDQGGDGDSVVVGTSHVTARDSTAFVIEIFNLSRSKTQPGFSLSIRGREGQTVFQKPAMFTGLGAVHPLFLPIEFGQRGHAVLLPLRPLAPSDGVRITLPYAGSGDITVSLFSSDEPVLLLKPSIRTFLIRYESEVVLVIVVAALVLAGLIIALHLGVKLETRRPT